MIQVNWKTVLVTAAIACAIVLLARVAMAKQDDKVYWCHCEPNSNCQTLHLPLQALKNAGHMNAQGNPLHAGDHAGACVEPTVEPTNTPEPTPTDVVEPSVTPEPTEEVTPTPTEEVTPEPTREPTQAPTAEHHEDAVLTNNTTNTPFCSEATPTRVEDIWVENPIQNDGKLTVRWGTNPNYGKAHIRYSEIDGEWRYALLNTDNDGTEEISGLQNGVHYWFSVAYVNGCSVGTYSRSFDPLP